jgi:imidazoleglycerol phosphate synthase glutamine amidotransferase subunit HisH
MAQRGALTAFQFHPEKSGEAGLRLLRRFVRDAQARQAA